MQVNPGNNSYTHTIEQQMPVYTIRLRGEGNNEAEGEKEAFDLENSMVSSSMFQSCVDLDEILSRNNEDNTTERNSVLIGHLEGLVKAAKVLRRISQIAQKENTCLVTAGYTFAMGLTNLLSGNLVLGGVLTACAVNEGRKFLEESNIDANDLISKVQAGVSLIRQLEEQQGKSLEEIQQQINLAADKVEAIEKTTEEIHSLAVDGSADGQRKKEAAIDFARKSRAAYLQAELHFQNSQSTLAMLNAEFSDAVRQLSSLIEKTDSALTKEEIDSFVKETKEVLTKMYNIQSGLESHKKSFNEGLMEFHIATEMNTQALTNHAQAFEIMNRHLSEIIIKSEMSEQFNEVKDNLKKANKEAKQAKKRANDIKEIAKREEENLKKVKQALEDQWGKQTMMVGTTVATGGVAFGGGVISIPAGFFSAAAYHYLRRIVSLSSTVFSTNTDEERARARSHLEAPRVRFDAQSSGYYGWLNGQPSRTVGSLTIDLGDVRGEYRFNRNNGNEDGVMETLEQHKLLADLTKRLEEGKLTAQECLNILKSLSKLVPENLNEGETVELNILSRNALIFREFKRQCKKMIKNEEKGKTQL